MPPIWLLTRFFRSIHQQNIPQNVSLIMRLIPPLRNLVLFFFSSIYSDPAHIFRSIHIFRSGSYIQTRTIFSDPGRHSTICLIIDAGSMYHDIISISQMTPLCTQRSGRKPVSKAKQPHSPIRSKFYDCPKSLNYLYYNRT